MSFLKETLNRKTNTITLNGYHLVNQSYLFLQTGLIKSPYDLKMKDIKIEIRNQLTNKMLIKRNAKVVFEYLNKTYLIIYNK